MGKPEKIKTEVTLFQLLPNMLTVAAICLGLTAIKLGFQGSHERAVQLILLACVLDGLDGRVARLFNSDSKMGAELDSLADFLNFGVAPPMVLYFWALQDMPRLGWISVQIFAVCCVIRLARFNVTSKSDLEVDNSGYFVGVPAPAGALLVMLPMFLSFAMDDADLLPTLVICAHMVLIGLLMISQIPTWSFKLMSISRDNVKYFLVAFAFLGAAILNYAWITLIGFCLGYVVLVIWTIVMGKTTVYKGF